MIYLNWKKFSRKRRVRSSQRPLEEQTITRGRI